MNKLYFLAALVAVTYACGNPSGRKVNQAGLEMIKTVESFLPNFCWDTKGAYSIGYGHACHVWNCGVPLNGKYYVPLTPQTGEELLKDDLRCYEQCVASAVTNPDMNDNQFAALVSFAFNVGCRPLQSSDLLGKFNKKDTAGAANEFTNWVRYGTRVIPYLQSRRAAERTLFLTPVNGANSSQGGGTSTPLPVSGTSTTPPLSETTTSLVEKVIF